MCIYVYIVYTHINEQKIWIEHFTREDIQIANKQIKRNVQHHQPPRKCNLNHNEILFHIYQSGYSENGDNTKCWQGCRKIGSLVHYSWEYKVIWPLWSTTWKFFIKLNMQSPHDLATALLGIYLREIKVYIHTKNSTQMFITALFVTAPNYNQPRCLYHTPWNTAQQKNE